MTQTIIDQTEDILRYKHVFLMGIKGVGMTALASCLLDAGIKVSGSDTDERFPTSSNLERLKIPVIPLNAPLPEDVDAVVYTGSHQGHLQSQVQEAIKRCLPIFSHMQALASLFDRQRGVAVCGVGGKSSISAMIAWVCEQIKPQSYAVGVGEILGLPKTGQYLPEADYFIAEADEYVADPTTIGTPNARIRFSYLHPQIIICPNLRFDHPDVYRDFDHTQQVFLDFFCQLKPEGVLVYNGDDTTLSELASQLHQNRPDITLVSFGQNDTCDYQLSQINIELSLPGVYNQLNALAALAALEKMGFARQKILNTLKSYRSVRRRMEFVGTQNGVDIWDDYAHHPSEIRAAIQAMQEKFPKRHLVVAFQPHTFSRTKALLDEFAASLALCPRLLICEIFPSARETFDPTVSRHTLIKAIKATGKDFDFIADAPDVPTLAKLIPNYTQPGDILLILGAGDIYHAVRQD